LSLVRELQSKLNRTRLIALRVDRTKRRRLWRRRCPEGARVAEISSVEYVAELRLKTHLQLLLQRKRLEYAHVLAVGREAAGAAVCARGSAERIRSGIAPRVAIKVILSSWIVERSYLF